MDRTRNGEVVKGDVKYDGRPILYIIKGWATNLRLSYLSAY